MSTLDLPGESLPISCVKGPEPNYVGVSVSAHGIAKMSGYDTFVNGRTQRALWTWPVWSHVGYHQYLRDVLP